MRLDRLREFQGGLKRLSKENRRKLRTRILSDGIAAPVFVWEKPDGAAYILDGHQRVKVLQELESEGYEIPPIPVAFIEAEDERDAREKLLAISSQYGEFDLDELNSWLSDIDAEIAESFRVVDTEVSQPDTSIPEDNKDIDEDEMAETEHECPKCGFRW